ncbi:hypothetical protein HDV01_007278 [Terramyces sp. JEL0728]|nr:hypothetical protein HDV01_007278 [Terramyces sp. JEL0728]
MSDCDILYHNILPQLHFRTPIPKDGKCCLDTRFGIVCLNGMIAKLDLSKKNLYGNFPEGLTQLKALTELILDNNQVGGPIPDSISNMTQLKRIRLDNNYLVSIPPKFNSIPSLRILDLSQSQYLQAGISQLFDLQKLETLNLSSTKVTGSFTAKVRNWNSMINLHADNAQLTGEIPDEFQYLTNMNSMTLSNNKLDGIIPRSLRFLKNIQTLDLRGNRFQGFDHELSPLISKGVIDTTSQGTSVVVPVPSDTPIDTPHGTYQPAHDSSKNSDTLLLFGVVVLVATLFAILMFTLGKRKGKAEKTRKILSDYKLSRSLENDLSGGTLFRTDMFRNSNTSGFGTESNLLKSTSIPIESYSVPEAIIGIASSNSIEPNTDPDISAVSMPKSAFPSVAWSISKEQPDMTPKPEERPLSLVKQVQISPAVSSLYTGSVLERKFDAIHRATEIRKDLSIWNEPVSSVYVFANEMGVDAFDSIIKHFFFPVDITFKASKDISNSTYSKINKDDIIEIHEHLYNGFFVGQNLTTQAIDTFPISAFQINPNTPKIILVHLPEKQKEVSSLFDLAAKVKEIYPDQLEFMTVDDFRTLNVSNIHYSGIFYPILNVGKVLLAGSDKMTVYMCNLFNDIATEFWTFVDMSMLEEGFDFSQDPYPLEFYDNE